MFGSILYNLWGALGSFCLYFFINFLKPVPPLSIILKSFIAAIVGFLLMYVVRYLITYICYTPEEEEHIEDDEQVAKPVQATPEEFAEENPEEVANVVKTMMHEEPAAQ
ncbi:hypothetical protein GCM10007425_15560 [Lysinibacillus alkalisoli]|uniref:Uncharacterized protein n=1 Tax=Lysinibacillus alkalisoli TaxID=1911548 RepID=A0A917LGV6_9BACI|nr:hypothetical protein [Lysinibacillus alkalisoli]GGG21987.1 hypothetical protein GCM10007425_15560 [Lysinibacillus alkalisoli]